MTHRVLSDQFLSHEDLGKVKAMDFPGHIGDPDPVGRMQGWQEKFGGTGEARHYDEGETPEAKVRGLQDHFRTGGEVPPVVVNHWKASGYMSMDDGHHRAVAAHLEGKGLRATVKEWDNI
jgi:hypothetical protein